MDIVALAQRGAGIAKRLTASLQKPVLFKFGPSFATDGPDPTYDSETTIPAIFTDVTELTSASNGEQGNPSAQIPVTKKVLIVFASDVPAGVTPAESGKAVIGGAAWDIYDIATDPAGATFTFSVRQ